MGPLRVATGKPDPRSPGEGAARDGRWVLEVASAAKMSSLNPFELSGLEKKGVFLTRVLSMASQFKFNRLLGASLKT